MKKSRRFIQIFSRFALFLAIFGIVFLFSACPPEEETPGNETPGKETDPDITHVPEDSLRIYIEKPSNNFMVGGKRIWINGANTPWNDWDEFGSTWISSVNENWWDAEFTRLKDAGINATRVWISCKSATNQLNIGADGKLGAPTARFWSDVDKLFNLAKNHKLYIMATLVSFDHFEDEKEASVTNWAPRWRAMLQSDAAVKSFVDNYTIPFVNRYKDNPYLWSIDICNEPDWIHENVKIDWSRISYWLAANAAAIHENSEVLVTVGIAYAKWNTGSNNPAGNAEGNKVSDQYLKSLYNNPNAYLDFWSPHYYSWNGEWYGVAHYLKPDGGARQGGGNKQYYGGYGILVDANNHAKPAILGECPANGTGTADRNFIREAERPPANNITNDYEFAFNNGWQGVMPWSSNGVDDAGNLNSIKTATLYMENEYPQLIFPLGK